MPLWSIVPSWLDIERRFSRSMGYQPGASFQRSPNNEPVSTLQLNLRRISNIRTAFIRAEWQAARRLGRRFADIDIASIINDLIDVVSQMAMIVAGSTLVGGAIGAGIGFGFFGIGALPSGAAGAAIGLEVSTWILAILGLASIAEFFVDGLPRIFDHYVRGIKVAWEGTRGEPGLNPFGGDDPQVVDRAAYHIAQGHEEVVVLLLGAIVVRDQRLAKDARERFSSKIEAEFRESLMADNIGAEQAKILAKEMADSKMSTLAALHNPDLFAGGKNVIGDFGDRGINSSIGPQWKSRIAELDAAAKNISEADRGTVNINAKLKRCD